MITEKDLIELGYKPNKTFKEAIEYANKNNLSGNDLKAYMDSIQPVLIEPYNEPLKFYKNVKADTPEDDNNIEAVVRDMNSIMITPTVVNGVGREIFKDPITDDGTKRSKKGLLAVYNDGDKLFVQDQCTWEMENDGELKTVFKDGILIRETTLDKIRENLTTYKSTN